MDLGVTSTPFSSSTTSFERDPTVPDSAPLSREPFPEALLERGPPRLVMPFCDSLRPWRMVD